MRRSMMRWFVPAAMVMSLAALAVGQDNAGGDNRAIRANELRRQIRDLEQRIDNERADLRRLAERIDIVRRQIAESTQALNAARARADESRRALSDAQTLLTATQKKQEAAREHVRKTAAEARRQLEAVPELAALRQEHELALAHREKAKEKVMEKLVGTGEYEQAAAALARVKAQLDQPIVPGDATDRVALSLEVLKRDADLNKLIVSAMQADGAFQVAQQAVNEALARLNEALRGIDGTLAAREDVVAAQQTLVEAQQAQAPARDRHQQAAAELKKLSVELAQRDAEHRTLVDELAELREREDRGLRRVAGMERDLAALKRELAGLR